MDVFEFILILVIITTLGKVAISVGGPLVDKLGDLVKELAASRRDTRETAELGAGVVEELEQRIARIEDRLDFLEALRAPEKTRALGAGRGLDRAGGPRGATEPGHEASPTSERTAGEA